MKNFPFRANYHKHLSFLARYLQRFNGNPLNY